MVEVIYIEFRKKEGGKKVGMECCGRFFEYGDRIKPSDLGISLNEAEELAANSNGEIKIIRKKR